eukprot:m.169624 g.169624  ORF g.169624 m.169624 type:complete len:296 (-) comp16671_c0_seq12:1098-1985(-)
MRNAGYLTAIPVALMLLHQAAAFKRAALDRPNIIVVLVDDFGYGDLSSYGHPSQEFGGIDIMAAEGIRFTQWYSAESFCTPSRAAIMTGRLPIRTGMVPPHGSGGRVLSPDSTGGLPDNETSLAEALQSQGYATHITGKWHLGINNHSADDGSHLPKHHGFQDSGLTLPFSNHWNCDESKRHMPAPDPSRCFLYQDDHIYQQPIDHSNLTNQLLSSAKGFISRHTEVPFFAYVAWAHMHVSMFNNARYTNTSNNGLWGDGVRELNDAVEDLLRFLRSNGRRAQGGQVILLLGRRS